MDFPFLIRKLLILSRRFTPNEAYPEIYHRLVATNRKTFSPYFYQNQLTDAKSFDCVSVPPVPKRLNHSCP